MFDMYGDSREKLVENFGSRFYFSVRSPPSVDLDLSYFAVPHALRPKLIPCQSLVYSRISVNCPDFRRFPSRVDLFVPSNFDCWRWWLPYTSTPSTI